MSEYIYKTPEGFNDILYNECYYRVEIEKQIRDIFRSYGYLEVDTPTLEYYDLFSGSIDALPQERMFKLFDLKGRILALRPDITVPIMRMAITKLGNLKYPLRLSYFGNVFRNDLKNLINCEYRQAGIEILGSDSIVADAEVIGIAIKSLLKLGITDFRIDIGQVKLFKALTSGIENEEILESIRQAVANKDKYTIEGLLIDIKLDNDKKENILKLPWLFGSLEIIDNLEGTFKSCDEKNAINELITLIKILKEWGYEKYLSIDLGMVQSLNYYSGTVFRGYAVDCGFSICWGGRYDYLSQSFNKSISATGCALGVNRIVEIIERKGGSENMKKTDYLVTTWNGLLKDVAFRVGETLRSRGYIVENNLEYNDLKIREYCKFRGIPKIVKVLDNDIVEIIGIEDGKEIKYSLKCFLG